jgi:hypothetical protein
MHHGEAFICVMKFHFSRCMMPACFRWMLIYFFSFFSIIVIACVMATPVEICMLCGDVIDNDRVTLTSKGLQSLLEFSKLRNDKRVEDCLAEHGIPVLC